MQYIQYKPGVSYTKKVANTNKSKSNPHKYYNKAFVTKTFLLFHKDQRQYNCSKEGHSMIKGNLNIPEKFRTKTKGELISGTETQELETILGQICKKGAKSFS